MKIKRENKTTKKKNLAPPQKRILSDKPQGTHVVAHIALEQLNLIEHAGITLGPLPLHVVGSVSSSTPEDNLFRVLGREHDPL